MQKGPGDQKIKLIQQQVDETKKIMEDNIDKMLARGEKLQALKDKTEKLKTESQAFNQNAVQLKQVYAFKNFTLSVVLWGAAIGAGLGLYSVLVAGSHWSFLPFCTGLCAALAYALTWPLKGLFELYQKWRFTSQFMDNTLMAPRPTLSQLTLTPEPVLTAAKPFQPQFSSQLKEPAETINANNVPQESAPLTLKR